MLNQIKIISPAKTLLGIDVVFNHNGFIFCLNYQLLEAIQAFQYNPNFAEHFAIQIPYRKELLEEAFLYGFSFITRYDASITDFKLNSHKENIEAFLKSNKYVIRTSISLDGDTLNQISKKGLDCLNLQIYSLIFAAHQWLVSRVLQSFKNQLESGFTIIYTKALAVISSVSFGGSILSAISSGSFQVSYLFWFFNITPLLFIPLKRIFLPILLRWLWRQLIDPPPRSKIAQVSRKFTKWLLRWQ